MIDLTYLKISTGDDQAIIKELINLFVRQLPDLKNGIVNAYKAQQWHELKEIAHKAKNSFEIMGVTEQAEELKQIEIMAGNEAETPQLKTLIDKFIDTCKIVLDEINELKL